MSRSKRDQRGKRIANEIVGDALLMGAGHKVVQGGWGDEVGSPSGKRSAKQRLVRFTRRQNKAAIQDHAE